MSTNPLKSLIGYSRFVTELLSQPNIKHHRVPAPSMSFTQPNLPAILEEIEIVGKA